MAKKDDAPAGRLTDEIQTVATPGGPVPIGAVATGDDAEERAAQEMDRREDEGRRRTLKDLSDEELDGLTGAEVRAIASAEGITDVPDVGRRALVSWLREQRSGRSGRK